MVVALALAVVGNGYAVDIVAAGEGQRQYGGRAFIFEGVLSAVGVVLTADGTDVVAVGIGDGNGLTA